MPSNGSSLPPKHKKDSELPNYKSRLKTNKLVESYVKESRRMNRKADVRSSSEIPPDVILDPKYSRRVRIINQVYASKVDDLADNEYGQLSSYEKGGNHTTRRRINLTDRNKEDFTDSYVQKYVTPNNNLKNHSLEQQSEATTKETNQYMSMKKISKSIDKLRMKRKLLAGQPLSNPTVLNDASVKMRATGRFTRMDEPNTPKLTVSKIISSANVKLDNAFKYTDKDAEFLAQHPLIMRRINNWGETLSPEYLMELKKKQRQIGKLITFY